MERSVREAARFVRECVELTEMWVEESYPEGRVAACVRMRRDSQTGALSYTAGALRTLDRLRALIQDVSPASSPGHVRTLREALGLTQQQFADRLAVSSQTVSRWERGEARPSATALRRFRRLQDRARQAGLAVPPAAQRYRILALAVLERAIASK